MSWQDVDKARAAVYRAALAVGRGWNEGLARDPDGDFTDDDLLRVEALAKCVAEFDAALAVENSRGAP